MACGEGMEGAWHLSRATARLRGRLLVSACKLHRLTKDVAALREYSAEAEFSTLRPSVNDQGMFTLTEVKTNLVYWQSQATSHLPVGGLQHVLYWQPLLML